MKIQSFLINPFLDKNYDTLKTFKSLHEGSNLNFDNLNQNIVEANNSNLDRLKKLMKLHEFEADACATRLMLNLYPKERIRYFFENDFLKSFPEEVVFQKSESNNPNLKFVHTLHNISLFVGNLIKSESEEHLNRDERIAHIRRVIEN